MNEAMEQPLSEILESDLIPDEYKRKIKKEVMEVAGIEEETMVGEIYNRPVSKDVFDTLRGWAFTVLENKSEKTVAQRS